MNRKKIITQIKNMGMPKEKVYKEYISEKDEEEIRELIREYKVELENDNGLSSYMLKSLVWILAGGIISFFGLVIRGIILDNQFAYSDKVIIISGFATVLLTLIVIAILIFSAIKNNRKKKRKLILYLEDYLRELEDNEE